jgi:hypothetical protein
MYGCCWQAVCADSSACLLVWGGGYRVAAELVPMQNCCRFCCWHSEDGRGVEGMLYAAQKSIDLSHLPCLLAVQIGCPALCWPWASAWSGRRRRLASEGWLR